MAASWWWAPTTPPRSHRLLAKYGVGGVDANPLHGLTKRQVRSLSAHLGLPPRIVGRTPTADLEDLRPGLADEEVLGLT